MFIALEWSVWSNSKMLMYNIYLCNVTTVKDKNGGRNCRLCQRCHSRQQCQPLVSQMTVPRMLFYSSLAYFSVFQLPLTTRVKKVFTLFVLCFHLFIKLIQLKSRPFHANKCTQNRTDKALNRYFQFLWTLLMKKISVYTNNNHV